jgi:hypothetical protein
MTQSQGSLHGAMLGCASARSESAQRVGEPIWMPAAARRAAALKWCALVAVLATASHATAGATFFNSSAEWMAATGGAYDTIDCNVGSLQFLSSQYADYGVHFDGITALAGPGPGFFPLDGWGVGSASVVNPVIPIALDGARTAFGVEYIFGVHFQLFSQGSLIFDSGNHYASIFSASEFVGVVLDQPFDAIKIDGGNFTTLEADNFYIGHPIPAPPVAVTLLLPALVHRRRRR